MRADLLRDAIALGGLVLAGAGIAFSHGWQALFGLIVFLVAVLWAVEERGRK